MLFYLEFTKKIKEIHSQKQYDALFDLFSKILDTLFAISSMLEYAVAFDQAEHVTKAVNLLASEYLSDSKKIFSVISDGEKSFFEEILLESNLSENKKNVLLSVTNDLEAVLWDIVSISERKKDWNEKNIRDVKNTIDDLRKSLSLGEL